MSEDRYNTNEEKNYSEDGQLNIDVYETEKELIIIAPVAGVRVEDINIAVTEDVLTIKGKRNNEFVIAENDYLIQECFWGEFSRNIVLPDNIDSSKINATFKNGILKISIPRNPQSGKTKLIKIKNS